MLKKRFVLKKSYKLKNKTFFLFYTKKVVRIEHTSFSSMVVYGSSEPVSWHLIQCLWIKEVKIFSFCDCLHHENLSQWSSRTKWLFYNRKVVRRQNIIIVSLSTKINPSSSIVQIKLISPQYHSTVFSRVLSAPLITTNMNNEKATDHKFFFSTRTLVMTSIKSILHVDPVHLTYDLLSANSVT